MTTLKNPDASVGSECVAPSEGMSAGLWRVVADSLPDGVAVHSSDGRILFANHRIGQWYEREPRALVGAGCADVFHLDSSECPFDQAVATEQPARCDQTIARRRVSVTVSPAMEGNQMVFIRVVRDKTEGESAHQQLIQAERYATLGQMISGIAHDVGTPLNIISGYSEYLLMNAKPDAQGYKELSIIIQQTRRIADFIKQMLDLGRPPNGRLDAIELKGFLAESIDLMGHHFRKANLKPSIICGSAPPVVYGDAARLRQAVLNILIGVCQRAKPDSTLEIALDDDAGYAKVRLSHGSGESEMDFSQILAGLLAARKDGEVVGLGLSLARDVLQEFEARVEPAREGGDGCGLVIFFPKRSGTSILGKGGLD